MKLDENRNNRLTQMAKSLSLDVENDSRLNTMLKIIDDGLGEAYDYLKLCYDTALLYNDFGCRMALDYLDKIPDTRGKLVYQVVESLSKSFLCYKSLEFLRSLCKVTSDLQIGCSKNILNIKGEIFSTKEMFSAICKVIRNYIPSFTVFKHIGDAPTWEDWEEKGFRFDEIDKLDMPFQFLETVKQSS